MDCHQNARWTIHSREQLARLLIEQGYTLKAAAAAFCVSQKTAAKWVRRYRQSGLAGLKDISSRPHHSPRQTLPTYWKRFFNYDRATTVIYGVFLRRAR